MQAGRLRHRLAIEQRVAGSPQRSSTGARSYVWTALATVWGSLHPLMGRRLEAAEATSYKATHEARIRHRADVATGMRIVFGGRYYLVNAVLEPEHRGAELVLRLEELPADG